MKSVTEDVRRGLLWTLPALLGGIVLGALLWRFRLVAPAACFLMAAWAALLYARGAGAAPRRGLAAYLAVVIIGALATVAAAITLDRWAFYAAFPKRDETSFVGFVLGGLVDPAVWSLYAADLPYFVAFAFLGTLPSIIRVLLARFREERSARANG